MPSMAFGSGSFKRDYGNLPEIRLVNFFAEEAPTAENQVVLQSRKGLTSYATRGSGPIRGIFSQKGVFDGAIFTVSNNTLYKDGTLIGAISGTGPVSWAASDTEVVVTRGTIAYSYNGTDLAAIDFPGNVAAVAAIDGLFLFAKADSAEWFWSELNDARTVDPLDFATAELMPDHLLDIKAIRGALYLLGQEGIEGWYPNGANADLPFVRIDQRLYSKGVIATGCVAEVDQILVMIGHDGAVYRILDGPDEISNHGIAASIRASEDKAAFAYSHEGHHFFCVRLDEETWVWDAKTGQWWEAVTYNHDNWRAQCAANVGPTPYFGDDTGNDVWTFGDTFTDDGEPLEGYFRAILPIPGGTAIIDTLEVHLNSGQTQPLSGDDATPVMEARASRDAGNTWGSWREASLGAQGVYRNRAVWRRWGMFDSPGAMFEFRCTDQSPRRISGVYYNEPGGGRSR